MDGQELAARYIHSTNRRKAKSAPRRAASGDDAELVDRHRHEEQPDPPTQPPQLKLFQGREPQSLAGMRRLRNASPPQLLVGKRKRHASTWLNEFVKDDLPLSPKKPDVSSEPGQSSKERSPLPLLMAQAWQSLGPPNADFLELGLIPKKRRSGSAGHEAAAGNVDILLQSKNRTEDSRMRAEEGFQLPPPQKDDKAPDVDAFTALRHALQQGSPLVVVKAQHIQYLLEALNTMHSALTCQGITTKQTCLQCNGVGPKGTTTTKESATAASQALGLALTGAGNHSGAPAGGALPNATLHEIIKAAVPNAALQAIPPACRAGLMTSCSATLPQHAAEPFTFFQRLDSRPSARKDSKSESVTKHVCGGSCNGTVVPVLQSVPAAEAPQQKICGAARSQVSLQPNRTAHPATAQTSQQQGRPQGCRPTTRSAVGSASAALAASQSRPSRHAAALLAQ